MQFNTPIVRENLQYPDRLDVFNELFTYKPITLRTQNHGVPLERDLSEFDVK